MFGAVETHGLVYSWLRILSIIWAFIKIMKNNSNGETGAVE
jgi:hypothetical protein